jgi:hypothetical protein
LVIEQKIVGARDRAENAVLAREQTDIDLARIDRGDERIEVEVAARRRLGSEVRERGFLAEGTGLALKTDR